MSANSLFCEMVSGLHATRPMWSLHNHSQVNNQKANNKNRASIMLHVHAFYELHPSEQKDKD